jgi:ornithine cyclodeaminase
MIGSGVQARSHLEALALVRTLSAVRVWSPTAAHREAFAREMQPRIAGPITVAASAREAVDGADVIALVTAARQPVIDRAWVRAGAHVCAVGACRPTERAMDSALVADARLFVDSRIGALAEAGDILMPIGEGRFDASHIAGELGEVALGTVPGRRSDAEITIFKSLGMAVEDIAAAHLAYRKAAERGLGRGFVL